MRFKKKIGKSLVTLALGISLAYNSSAALSNSLLESRARDLQSLTLQVATSTNYNVSTVEQLLDVTWNKTFPGDTVNLASGVYELSNNFVRVFGINLKGANRDSTIIDGGKKIECISAYGGKISDLTVRNGNNWHPREGVGGGIKSYGTEIRRCNVYNNRAFRSGGGIMDIGGSYIENCRIIGNTAFYGGGVCLQVNGTLSYSLVAKNIAERNEYSQEGAQASGGGVYLFDKNSKILNCTIANNIAELGGGVFRHYRGNSIITSTIIQNNTAALGANYYIQPPGSIIANNLNTFPALGRNCITNDPLFVDSMNGNYYLLPNSPCIATRIGAYGPEGSGWLIIPAWWKTKYGFETSINVELEDPDNDNFNNYCEYVAGTDPLDHLSYLKFESIRLGQEKVSLEFNSVLERLYDIKHTTNLLDAADSYQSLTNNLRGTGSLLIFEDFLTDSPKFYKLDVRLENPEF